MSVTSGFFNSVNGDRRYDARQMTALFNGIINDGIFANIGTAFTVSANGGNDVVVGVGRAWFNSVWVDNDAILPMTLDISEVLLHRYDAIVIEVDKSDAVRDGSIKVIKGTPSSSPVYPVMTHTDEVHQYPLAYIYRVAGSSEITQSNITSMIGTAYAPYITGILQVQNIDNIVAQWQDEWARWFADKTTETDLWAIERQTEFNEWFANIRGRLGDDPATALTTQVESLETRVNANESSITKMSDEVEELKKSVSDGKTEVAGAITEKGVVTAADASFETMAANILSIETGISTADATALASDILAGKSAYVNDTKIVGTMPLLSNSKVATLSSTDTRPVLSGKNDSGSDKGWLTTNSDGAVRLCTQVPANGYANGTVVGLTQSTVASLIGLSANKILAGNTILGIAGTGNNMANVGNVSKTHYVYKGQTIKAGDFVKFVSGIAGIGTAAEASEQTSNVLAPGSTITPQYRGSAPRIKCLTPTKVIRSWVTNQGNYYYMSQIGTFNPTSSPNIIWGTAKQAGWYSTEGRSPFPEEFERVTDDGSYYLGAWGFTYSSTSGGLKVSVYAADGTTMKSDVTSAFTTNYNGYTIVNGMKYLGDGKCLIIYSSQTSSSVWAMYARVISYDPSSNVISFGTTLTLKEASASNYYHACVADVFVAETSNTIVVGLKGVIYCLSVNGTTITLVDDYTNSTISAVVYESDSDAVISIRMVASMASDIFTLYFRPYTFSNSEISAGTENALTLAFSSSKTSCAGQDAQHKAVRLESGMYYTIQSALDWGAYKPSTSQFNVLLRLIFTYIDGTFKIVSHEYEDNSAATFHTCELIENSKKVVEMYGRGCTTYYTGNIDIYDIVKDCSNATISNINYAYETQVALAESNSDIEGVAITGGTGGSATAHNQQVTVRTNV